MSRRIFYSALIFFITGLLQFTLSGCSAEALNSSRVTTPITVNGAADDWQNYPMVFLEEQDILFGSANNDTMLYLIVLSNNRMDGTGSESKSFGLEYPVAMNTLPPTPASTSEIVLLTSDPENRPRMAKTEIPGIQVALKDSAGRFCYEIGIPLNSGNYPEYSIATTSGQELSVGFEMPQRAITPGVPGSGVKRLPAERIGTGSRGGGGRGNRSERMPAEPMEMWFHLILADNVGQAEQ
jgi:hypothetical protein